MQILVLLGVYFDAVVVFVTSQTLLFRLAPAILWYMSPSDSPDHPGSILYHSESSEVPYSTNQ